MCGCHEFKIVVYQSHKIDYNFINIGGRKEARHCEQGVIILGVCVCGKEQGWAELPSMGRYQVEAKWVRDQLSQK